jgi:integrase
MNVVSKEKNPFLAPFFSLLYETGCRTNEAERLQWDDIDYARKKVYIRASKRRKCSIHFSKRHPTKYTQQTTLPRTNKENVFPSEAGMQEEAASANA